MTFGDTVNALFQIAGALFTWRNVLQTYRDKVIRGVYWQGGLFFTSWSYWNIYYFTSLDQTFSFLAGVFMAAANTTWFLMSWYYWSQECTKNTQCAK